jgi:hypothetical protein
MPEERVTNDAAEPVSNSGGLIGAILAGVAKVWNAVTEDGYLAAAGRQGLGELGEALKAFPDSIQVHEPGTLWNPTQGEIAVDRADSIGRAPWPSEIANENRNQQSNGNGRDTGYDAGCSM